MGGINKQREKRQKQTKRKNKNQIAVALFLCLLLALTGCNSQSVASETVEPPAEEVAEPVFDIEEFKVAVDQCRAEIYDATVYLSNLATYEHNYLEISDNIGASGDNVVENAYEWLASESDATKESVAASHENIGQQYKEITLTEFSGKEAELIYASFDAMYQAYDDMYELVNTEHGSAMALLLAWGESNDIIESSNNDLLLFLGE